MEELTSISFDAIVAWLLAKNRRIQVPTLGGNSHLFCESINDKKILLIGSNGAYKVIGVRFWNKVCRRMDTLSPEERGQAGKFADITEWDNPDHFFAPSVPAICKCYILENR